MSSGLVRWQDTGLPHFITFSCFRHRPLLGRPEDRDLFCSLLERTGELYCMNILAYVVMPEHVHLLVREPTKKPLSTAMQVVKQRYSRTRVEEFVWERRYYDFNVISPDKVEEKLKYIHRNPVRRRFVERPEDWVWSSFRDYAKVGVGPVTVQRCL